MKIVLVNPNSLNPFKEYDIKNKTEIIGAISPSRNIGYLISSLKNKYDVEIIDHLTEFLRSSSHDKINLRDSAQQLFPDADIIGISMMTATRKASLDLIRLSKEISKAKIVVGGPHATLMPKQLLENYPIDFVVIGEAENSFPQLVDAIENKGDLREIKGIAFKSNGKVYFSEPQDLSDYLPLDILPDYQKYFDIDLNLSIKTISMLTAHGCLYKCRYCSSPSLGFRPIPTEKLLEEMRIYANKNIKNIIFEDDTFVYNKNRACELFERIISNDLHFSLSIITRFGTINNDMLKKFVMAGGKTITLAIETGSEKIRRKMNKPISNKTIYRDTELIKKFKINLNLYVMLGYPGETLSDLDETINMLKQIQPRGVTCSIYNLIPGSIDYMKFRSSGKIKDEVFIDESVSKINYLEGEELKLREKYRDIIYGMFSLHDRYDYKTMIL